MKKFFIRLFKKLFQVGNLAFRTIKWIDSAISVLNNFNLSKEGKELIKEWKELYPKQTKGYHFRNI